MKRDLRKGKRQIPSFMKLGEETSSAFFILPFSCILCLSGNFYLNRAEGKFTHSSKYNFNSYSILVFIVSKCTVMPSGEIVLSDLSFISPCISSSPACEKKTLSSLSTATYHPL